MVRLVNAGVGDALQVPVPNPTLLAAVVTSLVSATAAAQPPAAMVQVGAGARLDGAIARVEATAHWGRIAADVRALVTTRDGEASLLIGFGPRAAVRSSSTVAWDHQCIARLGAASDGERCWQSAVRTIDRRTRSSGWLGAAIGLRGTRERREVVAAARIHPTDDPVGEHLELGVTAVVGGRGERLFVHHAPFAPGWYVRGQLHRWRIVVGGEVGISGLAERKMDGRFATEVRALATIGIALGGSR